MNILTMAHVPGLMLEIHNDEGDIVDTNYWDSEWAKRGLFYLSGNAGTFRLLVPPNFRSSINRMRRGAKHVVVSAGLMDGCKCIEWLFEDDSDNRIGIVIEDRAFDRRFSQDDTRKEWKASVWDHQNGRPVKRFELPVFCRHVPYLPCRQRFDTSSLISPA